MEVSVIKTKEEKENKMPKRLKMLNKVEKGPANDKIVKNDGSCATIFFFFFIFYFGLKKKKEKKRVNEFNGEHGLVFS